MDTKDRELLELAAKAADYALRWYEWTELYGPTYGIEIEPGNPLGFDPWNPLTDDGDALRLAVKLKIEIAPQTFAMSRVDVRTKGDRWIWEQYSNHGEDAQKATRRAIVRAAAEIGREKQ